MSVKHAFLGILSEKPRHGYDLKQAFEAKLGDFWSLNFGQVYTTLERLRKDGLVEPRRDGQTIWYSVASAPARALLETLYGIYCPQPPACKPADKPRANVPRSLAKGSRQ